MKLPARGAFKALRAALGPALEKAGFARIKGADAGWQRPLDAETAVAVQFRPCHRYGGCIFAHFERVRLSDGSVVRQEFLSRWFTAAEVDELIRVHERIKARHPDQVDELRLEPGLLTPAMKKLGWQQPVPAPHGRSALLPFNYADESDVALWLAFLAPLLPSLLERFTAESSRA